MSTVSALKRTLVLAMTTTVLAACSTINPYTGERQTSNAVKVGAAGAVICGLIGATESSQRARNAAAGCGAIGAGIGAYMDSQEAELREQLAGSGVQVQRNGDQLSLIMPGNITFPTNGYELRRDFMPVLDSVAKVIYKYTDTRLVVEGHTDSTGEASYNYGLSERRANSVANYLSLQGVDRSRVVSQGFGEDRPIASNDSDSGRAQNRRVELQISAVPG
jgi:outer membrane protein OmpA-like peptidoglycan-associated protein